MNKRIVTFPHMGNYHVPASTIARMLGDEVMAPPQITRRTLEIGAKHSPESACIPFKYTLGNFIEALDQGANVILQAGGGCRMGFYGEVQKAILHKLGYEFELIKFVNSHNMIRVAHYIKQIKPELSYWQISKALYFAYHQTRAIDEIEAVARTRAGFEVRSGATERVVKQFLGMLSRCTTIKEIHKLTERYRTRLERVEIDRPENVLRVGLVGEIYVVMEPFSNFFVEKELAKLGIEVHRYLAVSGVIVHNLKRKQHIKHLLADAQPYLKGWVGGHGLDSVAFAHQLAKQGFDGVIHVKPFGCMPEINAMPALHSISQDYNIPIIYFSFDTLTSETGIKTRLEAFYDMLVMKKQRAQSVMTI